MAEEMRHHLEEQTARNVQAGMPLREAGHAARRQFGNVVSVQERARQARGWPALEDFLRDARLALRMLGRSPGFAVVVIVTLALGIGVNTALFSVLHAAVLRGPPFPESDRLIRFAEATREGEATAVSYPNFRDWREQQTRCESFGAYRTRPYALSGIADPTQIQVGEVSRDALVALRVQPTLGRIFTAEEDMPGGAPTVLLSDALWRTQFAAAPDILGRSIVLDGRDYTVAGVMPPGFAFPRNVAVAWLALGRLAVGSDWENRAARSGLFAIGRLRPGVTLASARLEMETIWTQLESAHPGANRGRGVRVVSLREAMAGGAGRTVWPLFGAAGLVLLIACVNVANLLLARGAVRRGEMAVRAALGAGRGRILRQLLVEAAVLSSLGAAAGVLLAHGTLQALVSVMGSAVPRVAEARLDLPVLAFSAAAAALAAVTAGLVPAWQASRVELRPGLQQASRGVAGRRGGLRQTLVVLQLALTVVLLVGAGLLLRSVARLEALDPGFAYDRGLTFRVNLSPAKYPGNAQRSEFFRQLMERLRALPGVEAATVASRVPLDGDVWENDFLVEGRPEPEPGRLPIASMNRVDPDYFRALGMPLLRGRTFTAADDRRHLAGTGNESRTEAGLNVIVIDEEFARRYWPGQDPIGQRIRLALGPRELQPIATVVGVVGRVKFGDLAEDDSRVQAYVPIAQLPRARVTILLRTAADPAGILAAVRREVQAIDPAQPVFGVRTLAEMRAASYASQRLTLVLLGVFATAALALAAVGLYGVLAHLVEQRRRELGVRLALGAIPADLVRLVLREGLALAVAGAGVGALAALAFAGVLGHLLFEVSARDPLTFLAVPFGLLAVALVACWLPARRAVATDPLVVLRSE